MPARPRRSVLYMPASNPRALAKARTLAADAIIVDLEDSVAPDQKPAARAAAVEAIKAGGFGGREVVLRINGPHTPWGDRRPRGGDRRRARRDPAAQGRRARRRSWSRRGR